MRGKFDSCISDEKIVVPLLLITSPALSCRIKCSEERSGADGFNGPPDHSTSHGLTTFSV